MKIMVNQAKYISNYSMEIFFSDGHTSIVDFSDFIITLKGYYAKYKNISNFKRFKIERGNVIWGKHADLIFPIDQLYNGRIAV